MSTVIESVRGRLSVDSDTFTITDAFGACMFKGLITKFRVTNLGLQIHGEYPKGTYDSSTIYIFVHGGDIQIQYSSFNR